MIQGYERTWTPCHVQLCKIELWQPRMFLHLVIYDTAMHFLIHIKLTKSWLGVLEWVELR